MTPFAQLATLAEELATESSRLKKRAAIAAALAEVATQTPDVAGLFCLYLAGEPFPETDPRKLNTGGAILTRSLQDVAHCTDAALTAAYRRHGDLGAAAFDLLPSTDPQPPLTLHDVAETFVALAASRLTAHRSALLKTLLQRATPLEAKYLLKLMLGDMRIGVKQSLIEEAIAVASSTDVAAVRHAVMLEGDLARATSMAFRDTLATARMHLFHPLGFMLASPVETPEEAIARFTEPTPAVAQPKPKPSRRTKKHPAATPLGSPQLPANASEAALVEDIEAEASTHAPETPTVHAFLEDKYDGMRAQIHCGDPSQPARVAIYSRNREDITESFPEIVEAFSRLPLPSAPDATALILDGELLAWDFATAKALPFSTLGQRIGRKRVDAAMRRDIPVIFMAFDILAASGNLLLAQPLRERRARLEALAQTLAAHLVSPLEPAPHNNHAQAALFDAAPPSDAVPRLMFSPARLVQTADEIDRAYADARSRANEGVMLKAANSAYLPGRRGLAWVKLKRELATLDVVITGAEFGHGRRAGLLSDYTFAVQDSTGTLLNVGKAYSGVTDAEIAELTAWLTAHTLQDHGHFRTVEPLRVLEVAFNNIMRSDRHASGFALRFPRILRIRDDKPVQEIDTLARVEQIYHSQPDKGRQP